MDDLPDPTPDSSAVTVMLIWILSGVIVVSAVYSFTPTVTPWSALNAAGFVAGVYLIALLLFVARKPVRLLPRILAFVLALTAIGATAFTWIKSEHYLEDQRTYAKERSEITVRGMIFNTGSQNLLQTLRTSQKNSWTRSRTLDEIFRLRNPSAAEGKELRSTAIYRSIVFYVETLKPDSIVLVATDITVPGRNPDFVAHGGRKGCIQDRFTLTRKGMVHESQN